MMSRSKIGESLILLVSEFVEHSDKENETLIADLKKAKERIIALESEKNALQTQHLESLKQQKKKHLDLKFEWNEERKDMDLIKYELMILQENHEKCKENFLEKATPAQKFDPRLTEDSVNSSSEQTEYGQKVQNMKNTPQSGKRKMETDNLQETLREEKTRKLKSSDFLFNLQHLVRRSNPAKGLDTNHVSLREDKHIKLTGKHEIKNSQHIDDLQEMFKNEEITSKDDDIEDKLTSFESTLKVEEVPLFVDIPETNYVKETTKEYCDKIESLSDGQFMCKICEHKIRNKTYVKYHIQNKHEGITWNCDYCDYQANNPRHLVTHTQSAKHSNKQK